MKIIKCYHDNSPANYFSIQKTYKFLTLKYYQLIFYCNIEIHVKDCEICLTFQIVCYKSYDNLQLLPVPNY